MELATVITEGNRHKFTVTFEVNGVATDPDTVTFFRQKLAKGAQAEQYVYGTASEVAKDSVGVYSCTLDFPDDGTYAIGAQGTGACYAYSEETIEVRNARAKA